LGSTGYDLCDALLAQYGIGPETTLEQFLVIIGGAAISALIVYFVPNKPVTE
jgi:hypothetical protein